MAKTLVKLKHKGIDKPQEFGINHAEKLLSMKNNGGWVLNDSNFILDTNGNIKRKSKGNNNESTAESSYREGDKT